MKAKEIMKTEITEKSQFKLIRGEFSPNDALDILTHLIQEKINFHNIKSFSQNERFGSEDEWSLARIEELKKSKEAIKVLIGKADQQGKTLNVQSNITIEIK